MVEPLNILTYEEKDIIQDICIALPCYFWIKTNTRNCYLYNDVQFYDITDQQINNDYNLSVGCISVDTFATGKSEKDLEPITEETTKAYITFSTYLLKTFECHIWSVKKNNIDTLHTAELVRFAVRSFDNMIDTDARINVYYRQLNNTTKPMTDCVFSVKLLTKDVYKREVAIFDGLSLEDKSPVKEGV